MQVCAHETIFIFLYVHGVRKQSWPAIHIPQVNNFINTSIMMITIWMITITMTMMMMTM